jgi:hypothetical protein
MSSYPDSGTGVHARARPVRQHRWTTDARLLQFDDYLIVLGNLRPSEREHLCLTHVEYGRSPIGGCTWWPKAVDAEADDAA